MNTKPLTPAQRALFQLIESIMITGFVAGAIAIVPFLTGAQDISWQHIAFVFLFALLISLAHSVVAYIKPDQPDLSAALGAVVDALERRYEQQQTQPMPAAVKAEEPKQ